MSDVLDTFRWVKLGNGLEPEQKPGTLTSVVVSGRLLDRVPWFSQRWASLEQEFKVSGLSPAVPDKIYFSFNRGLTATAKCKALLYWLDGQVVWR